MNIPLFTPIMTERKMIPQRVCELMQAWKASYLYANVEYEVDELGRDREVVERVCRARGGEGGGWDGVAAFVKDVIIVSPGEILSQQGRPYSVFGPWYKAWSAKVTGNPTHYIDDQGGVLPQPSSAKTHKVLGPLFNETVPDKIEGFELDDAEAKKMAEMWPVGEDVCDEVSLSLPCLPLSLADALFPAAAGPGPVHEDKNARASVPACDPARRRRGGGQHPQVPDRRVPGRPGPHGS